MKRQSCLFLLVGALALPLLTAAEKRETRVSAAKTIANFTLKDTAARDVSLADFKDKQAFVVLFLGTECPVNNFYMLAIRKLHEEFAPKGVQFLAINSNSLDPADQIAKHAKDHQIPFPVLKDGDQTVADQFKAERTPEAFVLDKSGTIVYRGRIDDQFAVGIQRPKPNRRDVAEALNEVLAGKPVSVTSTAVSGCYIGRLARGRDTLVSQKNPDKGVGPTYSKEIVRILQNNCQECHRPGEIGPFSLMTYEKAKAWSDTIREIVSDGRMPPWHADPRYGKFANDRSMKKKDKETLLAWIDQGCPKGDEKDLPPAKEFRSADGWRIGKPDVVFSMEKEFQVPATGPFGFGLPYKYIRIPTHFTEDKWIQAAEARPGNRAVVHHILVYVKAPKEAAKPGEKKRQGLSEDLFADDPLMGTFLVGTAPGDMPAVYPPGNAKKIPKGSTLVLQVHYTPNGIPTTDRSSVGFVFAKGPVKNVERTRTIMNLDFITQRIAIPAGDNNYKIPSTVGETFERDAMLVGFMPHMHLRGKSFEYKAEYPDGTSEILLSVPRFDFNWQSSYQLEEPKRIPAGTKILCTAYFDNSTENASNPDPKKAIRWGEQTWEEMMIGWVDYYFLDEKPE